MTHSLGSEDISNFAKRLTVQFVYQVFLHHELIVDETSGELQNTLDLNVAELEFDWEEQPVVTQVLGQQGQTILEQRWPFGDLTAIDETEVPHRDVESLLHRLNGYSMPVEEDDWVCVHYGGTPGSVSFAIATVATVSFVFITFTGPFFDLCIGTVAIHLEETEEASISLFLGRSSNPGKLVSQSKHACQKSS